LYFNNRSENNPYNNFAKNQSAADSDLNMYNHITNWQMALLISVIRVQY